MLALPDVLLLLGGIMAVASNLLIVTALARGAWTALRARWRPAARPSQREPSTPRLVLTLVHGTWGRRSSWTQPSSSLRRAVSVRFGDRVAFCRFEWSVANTFRARRRASAELARTLVGILREHPNAAHLVVAHSHGGNVALRALTPELMRALAGVACLATPVLVGRARRFDPVLGRIFHWVGVLPSFVAVVWLLGWALGPPNGKDDPVGNLAGFAALVAGLGSILLIRTVFRRLAEVRLFDDYAVSMAA
jgi:hypothetical protein